MPTADWFAGPTRIDEEEFYRMLKGEVIDDTELSTTASREWEDNTPL